MVRAFMVMGRRMRGSFTEKDQVTEQKKKP